MATLIDKLAARPWRRKGVPVPSPWQVQSGETIVERTRHCVKTQYDADPARGRITSAVSPVHYRNESWNEAEAWKPLDIDVVETPAEAWDCACESNGYQLRIWDSRLVAGKTVRCIAEFRQATGWMRVAPLALYWVNGAGQRQLIARTQAATRTIDNDAGTVTWTDAFGSGRHFRYNLRADKCFKTVVVDDASDLPAPTIPVAGLHLVVVMAVSWGGCNSDEFADGITVDDVTGDDDPAGAPDEEWVPSDGPHGWRDALHDLVWLQKPRAWDSATVDTDIGPSPRPRMVDATWRFRRYGNRALLLVGVPATMLQQATFPVYLDATMTQEAVGASADDAQNYGASHPGDGNYAHDNSWAIVGYEGGNYSIFGARFQTIPLAQGTTITEAHFDVYCTSGESKYVTARIACEDVDDMAAFASSTHEPYDSYLARTTAVYNDGPSPDWTGSAYNEWPELRGAMEEVLARGGWSTNQDLGVVVWCKDDSIPSGDQYHNFNPYDAGSNVPTLDAEYSTTTEVVAKTWTWDSTLESWSGDPGATDIAYTRETTDGDLGAGCLQAAASGNNDNETGYWTWTGDWEDLGVPSGATVSRVRLCQLATKCTLYTAVDRLAFDNTSSVGLQWADATRTDTLTLWAGRVPGAVETYFSWEDAGTWQSVPAGDQASTTSIEFRLYIDVDTSVGGNVELLWDHLVIEVEYTPGVSKHDASATITMTGGGNAAASVVSSLSSTLTATGGGNAAATVVAPLSATVTATGGGDAAASIVAVPSATITATGGGSATAAVVSPLSATVTAVGGGNAASAVVSPLSATILATGGGNAAAEVVAAPSATITATGGGSAAANVVAPLSATLAATGGGNASAAVVASLSATITMTGGGSAAATVEDATSKHDASATITMTGGGDAAATVVSLLSATLTATGAGGAAAIVVSPLSATVAMTGGGSAAAEVVAVPSATITASGGGSAAANVVSPLSATVTATGGGSAAAHVMAPASATITVTGGGDAAAHVYAAPSATLTATGGGSAAAAVVSPLSATLTMVGGGSAAASAIEPGSVPGYVSFGQVSGDADAELLSGTLSEDLSLALLLNMGAGEEVRDYSRQLNTLTMQGGMTESAWAAGPHGWALRFDGADDYLEGNAEQEPQWDGWGRGQHTFAAWIKLNGSAGSAQYIQGHTILCKGGGHPNGFMWGIATVGGTELRIHVNSANVDSVETMVTGQWYHVATVIDEGASEVRHYVNGVEDIVAHSSWGGDNAANLRMGANATNDRSNADIACVFAWDRSLTAAEVREHLRDTYGEFTRPEWRWTPTVLLPRLPAEATIDALWASGALAADYAEGAVGTDVAIGRIDRT